MPRNCKISVFIFQDKVTLTLMILYLDMREEVKKERSEGKLNNLRESLIWDDAFNPTNRVGRDNSIILKVTIRRCGERVLKNCWRIECSQGTSISLSFLHFCELIIL